MTECKACDSQIPAGYRWCAICHTHAIDPSFGQLASPARRLIAYALDGFIPMAVLVTAAGAAANAEVADGAEATGASGAGVLMVAFLVYSCVALYLFVRGTTPGKFALGMRVIREDGRRAGFLGMFIRETIGKVISGMIMLLGYIWILIDKDNQGWHDKLVTTYVVK